MNGHLEKNLVASCREGNTLAYAGLVKSYSRHVFAICFGMLGNSHDAEDVAQQVLITGFMDITRLRNSDQFGPWIGQIAKNKCVDFIRNQQRQRHYQNSLAEQLPTSSREPKEYPELQTALKKLPEEYRIVLMLYYFDGQNVENISKTLETSIEAVHTRMSRARKQLRELLSTKGGA